MVSIALVVDIYYIYLVVTSTLVVDWYISVVGDTYTSQNGRNLSKFL